MDEFYMAAGLLPEPYAGALCALPQSVAVATHEIRIREGCPVLLTKNGAQQPAAKLGNAAAFRTLISSGPQIENILFHLCGGSVHTYEDELENGFFTLPGGHRVGVGGEYRILEQGNGARRVLVRPTSLNLRIARFERSALPRPLSEALQKPFTGLLLCGEPDSGKTTLLRSLACFFSDLGIACAVVDERSELFDGRHPAPLYCDRISGIEKSQAVPMALRTLSPSVILLDEVENLDEIKALEQGFFSGVSFVATLHAANLAEAEKKPQTVYMLRHDMLRWACQLRGREHPCEIAEVREYPC